MTAFGAVESAVDAIQRGAYHYVTKPFKLDVVRVLIERAVSERAVRDEIEVLRRQLRDQTSTLIGRSPGIHGVVDLVKRVAPSAAPVLVLGETGTGKELVAREIHEASPRKAAPFVAVNCAALPEALLESELFGHVKGAFTGATQNRRGLFLEANGGTLLLDEIGEMPMALQAKLLRVLETGEIRAVGSDTARIADVRIVAATNRDLPDLVRAARFRQDLYFRLNVVPITIPPLRQRRDDVPLLLEHFVQRSRARMPTSPVHGFRAEAVDALVQYAWPGNVRELENLVDRWILTVQKSEVELGDVRTSIGEWDDPVETSLRELAPLHVVEQRYIDRIMERVGGNKTKAAEILQIDPSTIYRRSRQTKS
jgi:two-component system response regulator HydG